MNGQQPSPRELGPRGLGPRGWAKSWDRYRPRRLNHLFTIKLDAVFSSDTTPHEVYRSCCAREEWL
ncbi:hypothetical protein BQ8794_110249 [Mesorhizobium prunaredense]|uniref:Uncharacterized protein n=1 Tax=Mesorhizobium prunaredense TaxID=1631249 RepID=A0A1R3V4X8_9HYPH|nr:hypothetical protein BQ8794_110249 [Mesorhizobium prunaredense]